MSTEEQLSRRFANFHATTEPYLTGRGGAAARATVARRRRRSTATAALAIVLVIVVGVVALAARQRSAPDRLVPAAPPRPSPTYYQPSKALANSTLDLRAIDPHMCGGQVVKLKDNAGSVWRTDGNSTYKNIFSYALVGGLPPYRDLNGDGLPDQLLAVGCVGEGAGTSKQWLMYFTGEAPHLAAWLVFPTQWNGTDLAAMNNSGPVITTLIPSGGKTWKWAYDLRTRKLTEVR